MPSSRGISGDGVDTLRAALAFYADYRHHSGVGVSRVYNDRGSVARAALGKCPNCGGKGYVLTGRWVWDQDSRYRETVTCDACHGAGYEGARR